ncbi:glycosyltransferase [Gaetbulibacter sp. NE]|uniref:glycosyltransferase n=1 Tax=Gaetbulibacter sp. NE TaxID=2982307 RepID=UPI0021D3C5A7|nr:glycosyltransferase [Gaetbulibacter sp. NE]
MNTLDFSFIIPVFNRPDEVNELLESITLLEGDFSFEIVIVEDGSNIDCKAIVASYIDRLNISYYFKPNSGPGDSRNFGMKKAKGNYYIILDSDCLLPKHYLLAVKNSLDNEFVDCFGGPDAAHHSFTSLQKAINFAMTSFITTGGIRGGKTKVDKFQPRSFNMGLSKAAFEASGGFGVIHPGEDPDLSIRLINLGFKTKLINEAFVYHKRRISWSKFYKQVNKFGLVRPILNQWHPKTAKLVYWLPTLFCLGFLASIVLFGLGIDLGLKLYALYFIVAFILALISSKSLVVAIQAIIAIAIQFFGYGYGFLKSTLALKFTKKTPEQVFPHLFFIHG